MFVLIILLFSCKTIKIKNIIKGNGEINEILVGNYSGTVEFNGEIKKYDPRESIFCGLKKCADTFFKVVDYEDGVCTFSKRLIDQRVPSPSKSISRFIFFDCYDRDGDLIQEKYPLQVPGEEHRHKYISNFISLLDKKVFYYPKINSDANDYLGITSLENDELIEEYVIVDWESSNHYYPYHKTIVKAGKDKFLLFSYSNISGINEMQAQLFQLYEENNSYIVKKLGDKLSLGISTLFENPLTIDIKATSVGDNIFLAISFPQLLSSEESEKELKYNPYRDNILLLDLFVDKVGKAKILKNTKKR